ncbi:trans-aconitate 2-methyltransferase [Rhizobium mongolense]|uniref:Trans-aconitate 2-methyltransferase n=2 Tax=Rhizobium mongolense TaxID=57676 RepID=A0ABR6IKB1_9HYPH|nr:trans-aconitate 2-methyltransferase [Rhizobium mongolense]MBB4228063.1 trans-aconitate 2-methyltransferase [Rhizobium mongolense]TVZ64786.1 trans-aconitate 2-methyltransferase [Rhizobium mongolense USDA 1844]
MAWSASQYVKFEDERTRPARDLLAQVPLDRVSKAIDLGCGPGNSTELIIDRYGKEGVSGLDSDLNMLEAARKRLPGTTFTEADLATWQPDEPADLLFANAVFQWLPNHLDIFDRLMDGLTRGGVLAVQMPDNLGEPTHLLMEESAHAGQWKTAFEKKSVRRNPLSPPSAYYSGLIGKSARLDIWHTIYNHPMADAAAIVEWVKATGLMPYLRAAGDEHREAFLADYLARVEKAYPKMADGRVLLRFPRIFMVAVKG